VIVIEVEQYKGPRKNSGKNEKNRQGKNKQPVLRKPHHRFIIPDPGILYKAGSGQDQGSRIYFYIPGNYQVLEEFLA
jgi:hypothetical protein